MAPSRRLMFVPTLRRGPHENSPDPIYRHGSPPAARRLARCVGFSRDPDRSNHPCSIAHDGSPLEIFTLLPHLDTLGRKHQVDVVIAFGPWIPARLGCVRIGET